MEYSQNEPDAQEATSLSKPKIGLADLKAAFATVPDPRKLHNRTYSLSSLLLA